MTSGYVHNSFVQFMHRTWYLSLHNCTADIATLQLMDLASRYVAMRPTQYLWWQSHMTWHACLSLATVAIEESAMDQASTTEPRCCPQRGCCGHKRLTVPYRSD